MCKPTFRRIGTITGEPKLLIKGGNTGAEDLSAVKLFPLAEMDQELTESLPLSALPEASMYRNSTSRKGSVAVATKPFHSDTNGQQVFPDMQYIRKKEFWKLVGWHRLTSDAPQTSLQRYTQRAEDIHEALIACNKESGDPKNCYAVRRDLLDILIDERGLEQEGCELFCNPVNSHPRIHSRRCIPTARMGID